VVMRAPQADMLCSVTGLMFEEGQQRDSYRQNSDGGDVWRL